MKIFLGLARPNLHEKHFLKNLAWHAENTVGDSYSKRGQGQKMFWKENLQDFTTEIVKLLHRCIPVLQFGLENLNIPNQRALVLEGWCLGKTHFFPCSVSPSLSLSYHIHNTWHHIHGRGKGRLPPPSNSVPSAAVLQCNWILTLSTQRSVRSHRSRLSATRLSSLHFKHRSQA